MKKKISILTLTILFLVSTTGLSVSFHLCRMMQEKAPDECEVCNFIVEEFESSCCSGENYEHPVKLTSSVPVCCQDEFVYNKVEDDFIYNKSDVSFFSSAEKLFQPIVVIPSVSYTSAEEFFYCDSSPPFLIDPDIYITNSNLLI